MNLSPIEAAAIERVAASPILARTEAWVAINSGTRNLVGLATMAYFVALAATQDVVNPAYLTNAAEGASVETLQDIADWVVAITALSIVVSTVWEIVGSVRANRRLVAEPAV